MQHYYLITLLPYFIGDKRLNSTIEIENKMNIPTIKFVITIEKKI